MKYVAMLIIALCAPAWAFGVLRSQETNGSKKYCTYSDGTTITINSYSVCPTTID